MVLILKIRIMLVMVMSPSWPKLLQHADRRFGEFFRLRTRCTPLSSKNINENYESLRTSRRAVTSNCWICTFTAWFTIS